jgi:hypothetical protein
MVNKYYFKKGTFKRIIKRLNINRRRKIVWNIIPKIIRKITIRRNLKKKRTLIINLEKIIAKSYRLKKKYFRIVFI